MTAASPAFGDINGGFGDAGGGFGGDQMTWIVDYSMARPTPAQLRAVGAAGVMRYTGAGRNDGAAITAAEFQQLRAAGLQVGLVMEYAADWTNAGYAFGHAVATQTKALEQAMGIPEGVTYLAVDWDITLGGPPVSAAAVGNCQRALETFRGFADARGGWQYAAPYGSKWFCEWACAHSPMTRSWSTQAWSWVGGAGFLPAVNAALFQYAGWPSGIPIIGGCDFNEVRADWAPRGSAPPTPPPIPPVPIVTGGDIVAAFKPINFNQPHDFGAAPMRLIRGALEAWGIHVDGKLITPDDTNSDRTRRGVQFFVNAMKAAKVPVDAYPLVDQKTYNALFAGLEK